MTNLFGRFEMESGRLRKYHKMRPRLNHSGTDAEGFQGRKEIFQRKTDYPLLHDFARHVIHSTETLGVALDSVNMIIKQQEAFTAIAKHEVSQEMKSPPQTKQILHFQCQMIKNLKARSESNQLRLQNEINFVGQTHLLLAGQG